MSCLYYFKLETKPYTYQELVEQFQTKSNVSDITDLVCSKSNSNIEQDTIYKKLSDLRVEGFIKPTTQFINGKAVQTQMSYNDGEPVISDNESISCQELIDTSIFADRTGEYLRMSDEDYVKNVISTLKSQNKSEEEARFIAEQELSKWHIIGKDGAELHKHISDLRISRSDFQERLKGTKFEKVSGQLYDSINQFKARALGEIKKNSRGDASKVVYNLNLKTELSSAIEGIDKTLFGHIDMVVIDGNGNLHLFNYKVTTTSIRPSTEKLKKYKYQMALLKQILASHGYKVKNATLHIVPVKVGYNEDYSEITSAIASEESIELTEKNGKYVFEQYDRVARYFIKSTINTESIVSSDLDEASKQLQLIFPERDVNIKCIKMTAQEWIKKNRGAIKDSYDPDYAYEIDFGEGDFVRIKSHIKPEYNQEIIEEVLKRQQLLDTSEEVVLTRLLAAIDGAFAQPGYSFLQEKKYRYIGSYLNTLFNKYLAKTKEHPSDWELVKNDLLNGAGIILIKNKTTQQLDIMMFSPYDLDIKIKFDKGGDSVLGCHFQTATALNKANAMSVNKYKATYGNIEAIRAMTLLNQILPKIGGEFILGKLHVVSLHNNGQGIPFNMETLNKECFSKVLGVINGLPNTNVRNNFTNYKFVDRFTNLLQEYNSIVRDGVTSSEKQELIDSGFGVLANAETIATRLNALRQIEQTIREQYGLQTKSVSNAIKDAPKRIGLLYQRVVEAITYYSVGEISPVEQKISSLDKNVTTTHFIPNNNMRIVSDYYTKVIDSIAEQAEAKWIPIRTLLFKYYDDIGYSRLRNSTLGGQASCFDDLYRRDANGKRLLELLNPYDPNHMAQIKDHRGVKQQFLKKILFEFAKIKYPMKGIRFNFTSESDPALQDFIEKHRDTYFQIPLEKASPSTRLQNQSIARRLDNLKSRLIDYVRNPKQTMEQVINKVDTLNEQQIRDRGISQMVLSNKFIIGEGSERKNYIATHGEDFFETNLENLLADFIEKDIETREYNKALIVIKGVLFELELLGKQVGDGSVQKKVVDQTIEMIERFVKLNIFNASIMDDTSQKIMGYVAPLKKIVSDTLIAGNIISGARDTFEGVWQNTARALNHFQTDITKKALARAYTIVVKNSFSDSRSINIVNQLCQIYRLSNTDVARISEGLKSERGLTNFGRLKYSTLRGPDFLNRMTLFVAKCCTDGVYDAFDIKDGQLVYDWKKDERFKVFASGDKSNPKYAEQMGAYYNAIREYNLDHPEATIGYKDDLPMPYSFQDVEVIKNVAQNIYGSYDKSTRAAIDHMALGTVLGMFSTWMNGIYTNWFTKPGQYMSGEFKLVQRTDESGNLEFFDDDGNIIVQITDESGNIKYYYEGTNKEAVERLTAIQPVMDKVPIIIQGIWYTIQDSLKALGKGNFKDEIWLDKVQHDNLVKLFSDLLAWAIFAAIFGWALNPAYKEFKKGMEERDVITNATVELLYKSSSRSFDGFRGVVNITEFLGENTNPPIYSQNLKLLKETLGVVAGRRSVSDALNGNIGVFKTFQDTWRSHDRAQQKNQ